MLYGLGRENTIGYQEGVLWVMGRAYDGSGIFTSGVGVGHADAE
jgi:hypothetical protein